MSYRVFSTLIGIGFLVTVLAPAQPVAAQQVPTCTQLTYNLHKGSTDFTTNGQVSQLQAFLGATGYFPYQPVGIFGPLTFQSVQNFQAAHGIPATGYIGPITRNAIAQLSCQGSTVPPTSGIYIQTLSTTAGAPGTQVTIYGTGFTSNNAVILGGNVVGYVSSYSNNLTFTVPNLTPGTYTLYVQNQNGTSNAVPFVINTSSYGGYGTPYIQSLSSSAASVGTLVTVYGSGFTYSNAIILGGSLVTYVSSNGSSLSFTVPNMAPGIYTLYVQNQNGTSNAISFTINSYSYQVPSIQSVSPTAGAVGTTVTVQGSRFMGNNTLIFNGTSIPVTSSNGTSFTFTVPNVYAGMYTLYVQNQNGTSNVIFFTVNQQTLTPIVIQNSGSTNTYPYNLTINTDGSGMLNINNTTKQFTSGTFNYQGLVNDIQAVPAFSFPSQGCMKSASFGVSITLLFNGQTSGDITCPPSGTSYQTLEADVNNAINQACANNSCQKGTTATMAPVLSYITPSYGAQGTTVTLVGSGFTSNNNILISGLASGSIANGVAATNNGTTLTFSFPSTVGPDCFNQRLCPDWVRILSPGTYSLSVENINGTSNTQSFTYTGSF